MNLSIVYRERSDHARSVAEFVENLRRRYPDKSAKLYDIETRDGAAEASLYDIVQYPAVVVTSGDGRLLMLREGEPLPLIDEIASYLLT
jgi:hypothetical protein